MTDLEQIERMIRETPVISSHEVEKREDKNFYGGISIAVERGYTGFVAVLDFDDRGKLVDISAWE